MPHTLPSNTWALSPTGWLCGPEIRHIPSPNFNSRPSGLVPSLIVIHNISLPLGQFHGNAIIDLFTNQLNLAEDPSFEDLRGLEVSAHFLLRRHGEIIQFVSTHDRAWHAGKSSFQGRENCNDFSIGIELEGSDFEPFEDIQYTQLITLCQNLQRHYPQISSVQGHEHIAPGRKTDPGPHFSWSKLLEKTRWQKHP